MKRTITSILSLSCVVVVLLMPGVQHSTRSGTSDSIGINDLGISEFRISQTASELQIVGLDSQKAQVGQLSLQLTDIGRNLTVEVRGKKALHESKGHAPLHLPLLPRKGGTDLNAFLLDSHVSSILQKWGITLNTMERSPQPVPQSAEKACHECRFRENPSCMSTSCCEMPASVPGAFEEFVCCGNQENHIFVDRICTFPKDPNNPCGEVGGAGCAICWLAPYTKSCLASDNPNDPSACVYDFR